MSQVIVKYRLSLFDIPLNPSAIIYAMNNIALSIIALILAYLIGSFPSAFIIAKLRKGVDIRQVGSRNMGAMNTFYKVGFWWGMLVLVLDIGKGALAVAAAWLV